MGDFFTVSVLVATLASGIRLATPFLLAGLGETIGQRSGVLNLGVEGNMLLGAFTAYFITLETDNVVFGIIGALVVGAIMGLIYSFITLVMHAVQGISGIGIYLFGLGFTDLLFQKQVGTPKPISGSAESTSRCSATSRTSARSSSSTASSSMSGSCWFPSCGS